MNKNDELEMRLYNRNELNYDWTYRDGIAEICHLLGVEDMPEVKTLIVRGKTCRNGEIPERVSFYSHDLVMIGMQAFAVWTKAKGIEFSSDIK